MEIKKGQLWRGKNGVMFILVKVHNFDIHGLGACDIVSIDGRTSKYIGLGELTRNYTLVCNKGEIVKDKNNMQKELTGVKPDSREFNHYFLDVRGYDFIDIYRITDGYGCSSAKHHAVKKILCSGKRGAKDEIKDLKEAIVSLERQIEMLKEDSND